MARLLKRLASKAGASESHEAYRDAYVEWRSRARTPLEGFFSCLVRKERYGRP